MAGGAPGIPPGAGAIPGAAPGVVPMIMPVLGPILAPPGVAAVFLACRRSPWKPEGNGSVMGY